MALASYAELVTELGDYLNRADLAAKVPTFVRLFEAQLNRRLRSPDMEQTFTRTTVAGTLSYALNSRVRELREVELDTSATSNPATYTVTGESIEFDSDPGDGQTLTYTGYVTLAGLSDSNTTNWLLDDHPDAYLYGTLAQAYAFEKDEERAATYQAVVDDVIEQIKREANEKRMPAGPLQSIPAVRE